MVTYPYIVVPPLPEKRVSSERNPVQPSSLRGRYRLWRSCALAEVSEVSITGLLMCLCAG